MSVLSYHTASDQPPATDAWTTEVLPQLPPDLEAQARLHGALVRIRGLASASDLVRALLVYALDGCSFRTLGMWAVLTGVGDLSDTAWRKRLRQASPFLLWLLGALLAASVTRASDLAQRGRRILLVDATCLRQVGGTGDDWRVHLAYDLLAGRMAEVQVTDRHRGEGLTHFAFRAGDLIVADSGYGYRPQVLAATRHDADVIVRVWLPTFPLEDAQQQPFDAVNWLRGQHGAIVTWSGWCRVRRERCAVRLIAAKVPADQVAAIRKRKRRKAQRGGRQVTEQTLMLAGWVVLITTLTTDWDATEVLRLYRARWQIELLFKQFKQLLHQTDLRGRTQATVEATIRAQLVAWALHEQQVSEIRAALPDGAADPHAAASRWLLAGLSVQTLRQQVRGQWTVGHIRACFPRLVRFLVSSPRQRRQQAAEFQQWLTTRLGGAPPLSLAA
jgi:hypothetical protein